MISICKKNNNEMFFEWTPTKDFQIISIHCKHGRQETRLKFMYTVNIPVQTFLPNLKTILLKRSLREHLPKWYRSFEKHGHQCFLYNVQRFIRVLRRFQYHLSYIKATVRLFMIPG